MYEIWTNKTKVNNFVNFISLGSYNVEIFVKCTRISTDTQSDRQRARQAGGW